jgi:hypothetical protein
VKSKKKKKNDFHTFPKKSAPAGLYEDSGRDVAFSGMTDDLNINDTTALRHVAAHPGQKSGRVPAGA